jgi:hypothetical protein
MATAASSAAEKPLPSFEFLADSPPPRFTLSPNQYKYCAQALKFFKDKLQMPDQIKQEFALLQVFACNLFLFFIKLLIETRPKC